MFIRLIHGLVSEMLQASSRFQICFMQNLFHFSALSDSAEISSNFPVYCTLTILNTGGGTQNRHPTNSSF